MSGPGVPVSLTVSGENTMRLIASNISVQGNCTARSYRQKEQGIVNSDISVRDNNFSSVYHTFIYFPTTLYYRYSRRSAGNFDHTAPDSTFWKKEHFLQSSHFWANVPCTFPSQ